MVSQQQVAEPDKDILEEEANIQEASHQFRTRDLSISKKQKTAGDYKSMTTIMHDGDYNETEKCMEKVSVFIKKMCKCCIKKQEEIFDPYQYSSGESDSECQMMFGAMTEEEKEERVVELWNRTLGKARGAVSVLSIFGDLNRMIYLHGSTKKHEYLE